MLIINAYIIDSLMLLDVDIVRDSTGHAARSLKTEARHPPLPPGALHNKP